MHGKIRPLHLPWHEYIPLENNLCNHQFQPYAVTESKYCERRKNVNLAAEKKTVMDLSCVPFPFWKIGIGGLGSFSTQSKTLHHQMWNRDRVQVKIGLKTQALSKPIHLSLRRCKFSMAGSYTAIKEKAVIIAIACSFNTWTTLEDCRRKSEVTLLPRFCL